MRSLIQDASEYGSRGFRVMAWLGLLALSNCAKPSVDVAPPPIRAAAGCYIAESVGDWFVLDTVLVSPDSIDANSDFSYAASRHEMRNVWTMPPGMQPPQHGDTVVEEITKGHWAIRGDTVIVLLHPRSMDTGFRHLSGYQFDPVLQGWSYAMRMRIGPDSLTGEWYSSLGYQSPATLYRHSCPTS